MWTGLLMLLFFDKVRRWLKISLPVISFIRRDASILLQLRTLICPKTCRNLPQGQIAKAPSPEMHRKTFRLAVGCFGETVASAQFWPLTSQHCGPLLCPWFSFSVIRFTSDKTDRIPDLNQLIDKGLHIYIFLMTDNSSRRAGDKHSLNCGSGNVIKMRLFPSSWMPPHLPEVGERLPQTPYPFSSISTRRS